AQHPDWRGQPAGRAEPAPCRAADARSQAGASARLGAPGRERGHGTRHSRVPSPAVVLIAYNQWDRWKYTATIIDWRVGRRPHRFRPGRGVARAPSRYRDPEHAMDGLTAPFPAQRAPAKQRPAPQRTLKAAI